MNRNGEPGGRPLPAAGARALFPGAARRPYLNVAVRSLLATPVRAALDRYLEAAMEGGLDKAELFHRVERGRERFARWIGAGTDEVAWIRNVTDGLNLFLGSLDWRKGDEVVLCPDLEHPANVLPWRNLAATRGVRLVPVPAGPGREFPAERMAEAVTPRTRVITVATVSFSPGFRCDLRPLAEAKAVHGALLVLDAAQSVGVLRTNVQDMQADALSVATQKGLAALYGTGFLYCRREVAESLAPTFLGRFGVDLGDADETEVPPEDAALPYAAGARRFDLGNYNYPGVVAAEAALAMLARFGARAIEARAVGLARRLASGLEELGLPVAGGAGADSAAGRSHIVAVGAPGGGTHRTTEDPAMNGLAARIRAAGVRFSIRRGILRFSFHMWNDRSDVDRVVEAARRWISENAEAGGF